MKAIAWAAAIPFFLAALTGCRSQDAASTLGPDGDSLVTPVPPARDTVQWDGCWSVAYQDRRGHLIASHDSAGVTGAIAWEGGLRDTLIGTFGFPYLRFALTGAGDDGQYVGNVLRTFNHFEVKRIGTPGQMVVKMIGDREACVGAPALPL